MDNPAETYLEPTRQGALKWGALSQGTLVKRYKRFLADVVLDDGTLVTAHTANTGAMLGCSEAGRRVWLSDHEGRGKRKYRYTWEMIEMPDAVVGVNTGVPNRLVRAAAGAGAIPEFPHPAEIRSEVRLGDSRIDLHLRGKDMRPVWVEIKNCSLVENGVGFFPDAVTARGAKHLGELAGAAANGDRAIIFILVQRGDADAFSPADHIDPEWGRKLREVLAAGVELLAYRADLDSRRVAIGKRLPVKL